MGRTILYRHGIVSAPIAEAIKATNPQFHTHSPAFMENCQRCVSAYDAVPNKDTYTEEAAKKALMDASNVSFNDGSDTAYILTVPYLEVEVESYDETAGYTVDITPKVKVVAATVNDTTSLADDNHVEMLAGIEVQPAEPVNVEIGIPTGIAANDDYVSVNHNNKETFIKKVASAKVTVTVDSFSPFTITKLANAVLENLALSAGSLTFDPATLTYNVTVGNEVESITVTPTAGDASWTIKVNDVDVTSGQDSSPIPQK